MEISQVLSQLEVHQRELKACRLCPAMCSEPVVGKAVPARILLIGQAPGDREPRLKRPFAWTAGRTLFSWIHEALGWTEEEARERIYFAAVCRCFPGKGIKRGDRIPDTAEVKACSRWLMREFEILNPALVLTVGKLATLQLLSFSKLSQVVGQLWKGSYGGRVWDVIPLPHPSGISRWHYTEVGKSLLGKALNTLREHPVVELY